MGYGRFFELVVPRLFVKFLHMKWHLVFLLNLAFITSVFPQEYARHYFNFENSLELGVSILQMENSNIVIAGKHSCDTSDLLSFCYFLRGIEDSTGDTLWMTRVNRYDEGVELDPSSRNLIIQEDTIYSYARVWNIDHLEISLMAFGLNGDLLYWKDILIPHFPSHMYIRGMTESHNNLIVYGKYNIGSEDYVFIKVFDHAFNELFEHLYFGTGVIKRGIGLTVLADGGYVLAFGENEFSLEATITMYRLDEQFNVLYEKEIPETKSDLASAVSSIVPTKDGGFLLAWQKEIRDSIYHYDWPSALYKVDSVFNLEWEYVFLHRADKNHKPVKLTSDGNILGFGTMDYFSKIEHFTDPIHINDGWCYLITPEGELLWEHSIAIADPVNYKINFVDGIETETGYAFVGSISLVNPTGEPFLNNQDALLLTLDKNGCWNGNCNEYIIITGDTTSTTIEPTTTQEPVASPAVAEAKIYPNPTTGILTFECESWQNNSERLLRVVDQMGRTVFEQQLIAPKSTVNLRHLPPGLYFATYLIDGRVAETHKIFIHQ